MPNRIQIIRGRQNSVRADQPCDLKNEGVKRGKENQPERAKKNPPRAKVSALARFRRKQPIRRSRKRIRPGAPRAYRAAFHPRIIQVELRRPEIRIRFGKRLLRGCKTALLL